MSAAQADEPAVLTTDPLRIVPVRHWGRWVSALVIVALVVWLLSAIADSNVIQFQYVRRFLFNPSVLEGVRNTIVISVSAQLAGIALGVVLAVMRLSANPVLSVTSWVYVWLFRGTPVLVQLFFWFSLPLVFQNLTLGIPFVDETLYQIPMVDFMTPFKAALFGLALNEAAYMAEIVRAGILSVDPGQVEASQALGMRSGLTLRRIVLPQAMRVVIPPTGNEFISMMKTSALASLVLFPELTRRVQDIYSANFRILELLVVASIWYLALTTVASIGQYYLERRFAWSGAADGPPGAFQRVWTNLLPVRRSEQR